MQRSESFKTPLRWLLVLAVWLELLVAWQRLHRKRPAPHSSP
jgi:hypothetical protein